MTDSSNTIKRLRAAGHRNTSPIKRRADGGRTVDDPDDADAVNRRGLDKFHGAIGTALAGSAVGGTGAGAALGANKAIMDIKKRPMGKVGWGITGPMIATGVALGAQAMKKAGEGADDILEAKRLRQSPPQSKPPDIERKAGGRVKTRLDRPKRAEGGPTTMNKFPTGISEDSKSKARAADRIAEDPAGGPINFKTLGAGTAIGAGGTALVKGVANKKLIPTAIGAGLTYLGTKLAKDDFGAQQDRFAARREADDIRAGKPIEGEEDRKKGGRVGKRK